MARDKKTDIALNPLAGKIDLVEANAPEDKAEQELMEIKSGFTDEQRNTTFLMGQRVGRKQITSAIQKLLTVTDLVDLQTIKETKQYKGYRHIGDDGKVLIIKTFEDFCIHIEGRSVESVDLELANFKQLGEAFFDAMRQIGIGPATMRDYRKLPDDEKQALLEVAQNGDKDSFVELASTLITKHQREKEAADKKINDLVENAKATDSVIKKKDDKLNELDREIEKMRSKAVEAAPDMQGEAELIKLQDVTRNLTVKIQTELRQVIIGLTKSTQNGHGLTPKHIDLAIAQAMGLIITASYQVADDYMIQPILDTETAADDPAKADAEAFLKWNAQQSGE